MTRMTTLLIMLRESRAQSLTSSLLRHRARGAVSAMHTAAGGDGGVPGRCSRTGYRQGTPGHPTLPYTSLINCPLAQRAVSSRQ